MILNQVNRGQQGKAARDCQSVLIDLFKSHGGPTQHSIYRRCVGILLMETSTMRYHRDIDMII